MRLQRLGQALIAEFLRARTSHLSFPLAFQFGLSVAARFAEGPPGRDEKLRLRGLDAAKGFVAAARADAVRGRFVVGFVVGASYDGFAVGCRSVGAGDEFFPLLLPLRILEVAEGLVDTVALFGPEMGLFGAVEPGMRFTTVDDLLCH